MFGELMKTFDFIMAGGGLAGLSLAYQLVNGPYPDASILILDSERAGSGERTWCFWSDRPVPFDSLAYRSWPEIRFRSHTFNEVLALDPYEYRMIRGVDFYDHVLGDLESRQNVEFRTETVREIVDGTDRQPQVKTNSGSYESAWVFDSRFDPEEYVSNRDPAYHHLMQHFRGWFIETERPVFEPQTATLFDFCTPQKGEMRFVYVLPFGTNRALVEFTLFSASLLSEEEYTGTLDDYVSEHIDPGEFRVVDAERGVIPMTDQPFVRRQSPHVLNTGTRGGLVKASTGYAFKYIQADTSAIVNSLRDRGHPFDIPRHRKGFGVLDTMLLQIMFRRGWMSETVFTRLFSKNPVPTLLRFLDEEASVGETMRIMASVPWLPFIGAWFRTKLLRKV